MTSIIKFQAISGAQDESPPCFILQIDELRILLDCGWDEHFNQDYIKELKKHIHLIDVVLISHPDPLHLGALPYLVGKCGLNCPIYATIPVYKMGQMFMYDLYQSRYNMEDFQLFTLDDVDAAFDKVIQLKYNQSVPMKGKGYGVTITPLPAGHMIGGAIWKIFKAGEEDIYYAVDYNHKKERHLNGCELEKIQRPSLLITDGYNASYQQARRRIRDEKLMTNILQTLRNNGNVLITVDTAGRVLELAHMLEQLWRNKDSGLLAYSLALLNNVSYNTIEFAKSQIEWMSEKLMRSFEGARNNPFQFKYLQLCHSFSELSKVPNPKVVLASFSDMECGFSRELFLQWSANPCNSIILTNRSCVGTLARDLIDNGGDREINIEVKKRVKLEGAELDEYLKKTEEENDEKDIDLSSDSDDEIEMIKITKGKHDFPVRDVKPQTGFFKTSKKQSAMFPFYEVKHKFDDYGEIIKPESFKIEGDKIEDIKEEFSEELPKADEKEHPTKCITYNRQVEIKAQIQYIDFEGRSDGGSIMNIINQIRPRRLVLVRGTTEDLNILADGTRKTTDAKIYIPSKLEIVDATTETYIYQIRLTECLISSLNFQKAKDAEVAWLDGKVIDKKHSLDARPAESEMDVDEEIEDDILTLDNIDMSLVPSHETSFINELKLSDFKKVLNKKNIACEFSGGVLWCSNGTLAIRRLESGRIVLEGILSDDYFTVRELLYEQYAIV